MNRTTTQVQATANNNAHFVPMCIYKKNYDSRKGNHSYAMWTTGEAYVVQVGRETFSTGFFSYDTVYLMRENDIKEMGSDSYESWETISFEKIHPICQKELSEKMGDMFPWDASFWGTKEKFEEYWEPQTFEGKIEKSLRNHIYFYKNVLNSKEYQAEIETRIYLDEDDSYIADLVIMKNGEIYEERSGYSNEEGYWATLKKVTAEKSEQLLKERKAREALARKEHARKCGVMARKYGIRFEISLRCFKGDEEDIKNFVESLKKAFGKDFNDHELSECGRARRKAEIERLGIEIGYVDPNHIAEYILECLYAGEIVK